MTEESAVKDQTDPCAVREGRCALGLHETGQVSAALLWEQERGKQAAGAGRMVSPL